MFKVGDKINSPSGCEYVITQMDDEYTTLQSTSSDFEWLIWTCWLDTYGFTKVI